SRAGGDAAPGPRPGWYRAAPQARRVSRADDKIETANAAPSGAAFVFGPRCALSASGEPAAERRPVQEPHELLHALVARARVRVVSRGLPSAPAVADDRQGLAVAAHALAPVDVPHAALLAAAEGRLGHAVGHGQVVHAHAAGVDPACDLAR